MTRSNDEAASTLPDALTRQGLIFWVGFALILLVSIGLRLWNLEVPDLWTDEVFTEFRALAPLQESLDSMWAVGNQNPLYYFTLRPLGVESEFDLRLPSVVMGVTGLAALMLAARYFYADNRLALWAGVLVAVSPFHVMVTRTARPYPMVFLFCLLASICFLLLLRGKRSPGVWLAFIVTSMIAYLTHYSAAAIGAAQLIYLAWLHHDASERPFLLRWFGAQVIAALPFVVWMILLALNFESTYEGGFEAPPTLAVIPVSLWNLLFGYDGTFSTMLLPALIIGAIGMVWAGAWAISNRRQQAGAPYWLLLTVLSITIVMAFTLLISPAYQDRYFTVFLPGFILLFVGAWLHLPARIPAWVGTLALVIITATATYNTYDLFNSGDYWRADWKSADAYITANYAPEDGFLFERDHPQQAFERYFSGDDAWLGTAIRLQETPDTAIFEAEHERIWVVYRNPVESLHRQGAVGNFDPFDADLNPLGAWLAQRQARVIEQRSFNGVTILLLAGA